MWKKQTISEQTADAILQLIKLGELSDHLPGEHVLSQRLGVSRGSLREALKSLENKGVVEVSRGKRRKICCPSKELTKRDFTVTFLLPRDLYEMGDPLNKIIAEVRSQISGRAKLQTLSSKATKMPRPGRHLEKLTQSSASDCWILVQSSAATQRWFNQHKLPTLILGTVTSGVSFPSVDSDWGATGIHLANLLARHHQQHLLIFERHIQTAGSIQLKSAYSAQLQTHGITVKHVFPEHGVKALLEKNFPPPSSKMSPFSCVIFYEHEDLLTGLTWLLAHGWRIPEDLSIICLDAANDIDQLYPAISHYRRNTSPIAKAITRSSMQITQGIQPIDQQLYLQEYIPAASLLDVP